MRNRTTLPPTDGIATTTTELLPPDAPEASPGAKAAKSAYKPDPELRVLSRITRMLSELPPEAQQRVGVYLASRYERKVQ